MIHQLHATDVFEIPDPKSLREPRIRQSESVALAYATEAPGPARWQLRLLAVVGIILGCTSICVPVLTLFIAESAMFGAGLMAGMLNPFVFWIKDEFGINSARVYIFSQITLSAVLLIGSIAAIWRIHFGRRMLLLYAMGSICLLALASTAVLKSIWGMLDTDELPTSIALLCFVPHSFLLHAVFPAVTWIFLRKPAVRQLFAAREG